VGDLTRKKSSNDVNKTSDLKNKNRAEKGETNLPTGKRKRYS
jgi:hypothetical protein